MISRRQLSESVAFLKGTFPHKSRAAVILGSGLGDFARQLVDRTSVDGGSIPHYPVSTVAGHAGRLIQGRVGSGGELSEPVIALQGRVHFYESGTYEAVLYPVLVLHRLGVRRIVLTNAAGGMNKLLSPGDIMLITDTINMSLDAPLDAVQGFVRGRRRFSPAFSTRLLEDAQRVALDAGVQLRKGVYVYVKGPSYETAAEIEAFRRMGADAVGMSTVPELTLASALGMEVLGVSLITNYAAGISVTKLSHEEVTVAAANVRRKFAAFMKAFLHTIA